MNILIFENKALESAFIHNEFYQINSLSRIYCSEFYPIYIVLS